MAKEEPAGNALVAADFSKDAVSKAVLKAVASKWYVVLPAVIGVVGLTGLTAGAALPPILLYFLTGGAAVGGGAFLVNYFGRYDENAHNYLETIRSVQRQFVAEVPKRLRSDLKAADCEKGLRQLEELEAQFEDFQHLLGRKFSTNGMTMGRFLGTAEQVRAGALYKLQMVLDQLKAVESIPADLGKKNRGHNQQNGDQAHFIDQRAKHREEALAAVERLHTDVEQSLTSLSEISVRIAKVGMGEDEGMRFESYLDELQALATQASTFHKET